MKKFSKEILNLEPLPIKEAIAGGYVFYGDEAIAKVEEMEGELTPSQKRIVRLEGFVSVPYLDTKGNWTIGAGLTKDSVKLGFKGAFDEHAGYAKRNIKGFDRLPPYLRDELTQAAYRGDLKISRKFRKKFNAADTQEEFAAAAEEFLDSDDYRESLARNTGVAKRMEALAAAVNRYGSQYSDGIVDPTQAPLVDIESEVRLAIQSQLQQENVAQRGSESLSEPVYSEEEEKIIQMLMAQEEQQKAEDMFDQAVQQEDEYLSEYSDEEEKIIQGLMDGDIVKTEEKTDQDYILELYWS